MRVHVPEKYERYGWPSVERPDLTPPEGWSLPLINSSNRVYQHRLSPDGERIAFIWNREEQADIHVMPSKGGWPSHISLNRVSTPYWWDRAPQWSPDGKWLAFRMNGHIHLENPFQTAAPAGCQRIARVTVPTTCQFARVILSIDFETGRSLLYTNTIG